MVHDSPPLLGIKRPREDESLKHTMMPHLGEVHTRTPNSTREKIAADAKDSDDDYLTYRRKLLDGSIEAKILSHIQECDVEHGCAIGHIATLRANENIWSSSRISRRSFHSSFIFRVIRFLDASTFSGPQIYEHVHGNVNVKALNLNQIQELEILIQRTIGRGSLCSALHGVT